MTSGDAEAHRLSKSNKKTLKRRGRQVVVNDCSDCPFLGIDTARPTNHCKASGRPLPIFEPKGFYMRGDPAPEACPLREAKVVVKMK